MKELSKAQTKKLKEESPHAVLEESGIAFDPSTQHLDLSKEEKRRTTAIMLAIQAYQNLIIKDADYLREANAIQQREGVHIQPATMNAMVEAAAQFDTFIEHGVVLPSEEVHRVAQMEVSTDGTESSNE